MDGRPRALGPLKLLLPPDREEAAEVLDRIFALAERHPHELPEQAAAVRAWMRRVLNAEFDADTALPARPAPARPQRHPQPVTGGGPGPHVRGRFHSSSDGWDGEMVRSLPGGEPKTCVSPRRIGTGWPSTPPKRRPSHAFPRTPWPRRTTARWSGCARRTCTGPSGLAFLLLLLYKYWDQLTHVFLLGYAAAILAVILNAVRRRLHMKRKWLAAIVGLVVVGSVVAALASGDADALRAGQGHHADRSRAGGADHQMGEGDPGADGDKDRHPPSLRHVQGRRRGAARTAGG